MVLSSKNQTPLLPTVCNKEKGARALTAHARETEIDIFICQLNNLTDGMGWLKIVQSDHSPEHEI
jgi:hypothetical protein